MGSKSTGQQDGILRDQLSQRAVGIRDENQKIWPKRHRTEIAASVSSILSTFAAVR